MYIKRNLLLSDNLDQIWLWKKKSDNFFTEVQPLSRGVQNISGK